jgi:hypothetical protein
LHLISKQQKEHIKMKHYTARQLRNLPTISQGQFSNLKIDDGKHRVWLSRMTVADGMPYNNAIEVEALLDGVWTSVAQYPGVKSRKLQTL